MAKSWESYLARWSEAGLVNPESVDRIRSWEGGRDQSQGLGWPVRIALVFGAILLGAGIALFVSAHWDELSPRSRMTLLLAILAALHGLGAAASNRFEWLSVTLHAVGTMALGPAIALTGQIFNLNEHWPSAMLLWAIGAAIAWALLGHWTQGALCAILFPWWLASEWEVRSPGSDGMLPAWVGLCSLCFAYLSSWRTPAEGPFHKALAWLGGIALMPMATLVAVPGWTRATQLPKSYELWIGWSVAILVPLVVSVLLRGWRIAWNAGAMAWSVILGVIAHSFPENVGSYAWCAAGGAGLAAWGIFEARPERVNLGIAGFAITVLAFYFARVMDALGRSASLIGIGLLFLGGGWLLERTRRRLIARIGTEAK